MTTAAAIFNYLAEIAVLGGAFALMAGWLGGYPRQVTQWALLGTAVGTGLEAVSLGLVLRIGWAVVCFAACFVLIWLLWRMRPSQVPGTYQTTVSWD